jgi:xanthine dehydrogenase accessory factor
MGVEIFEEAVKSLKGGQKIAICTVVEKVGSGPRGEGTKILVREDGTSFGTIGGGAFERILKQEAMKSIQEGRSRSLKFSLREEEDKEGIKTGLWCGGVMTVFVDVVEPKPKMVLVGSGHIALPTYKIGELLGFEITVVDNNFDTATRERFPKARIICREDFEAALKEVEVDKSTCVLIVYGEPMFDLAALRRFVNEDVAFLGILGSPGKIAKLKQRLKEEGVAAEKIERIKGPIGLNIGAKTPEEIAVSIMAELIKYRAKV